jgi:RNase P/RNase MRP subunit p30
VLLLDFYDIIYDFDVNNELIKRLGFKKAFILGKELTFSNSRSGQGKDIGISKDIKTLEYFIQNKFNAILIDDYSINKKIIADIKEKNIILYFSLSAIMSAYGIERSKIIYKMSRLFSYAKSKKVNVCFASFAQRPSYLASVMQLIELAKLVGADERYSRYCLSEITRSLVDAHEK